MRTRLPDGTTPEQWSNYYTAVENHKSLMESRKPKRERFRSDEDFKRAMSEWDMAYHCDAPNAPGYYRANND